jgi:hypothetical protein
MKVALSPFGKQVGEKSSCMQPICLRNQVVESSHGERFTSPRLRAREPADGATASRAG